MNQIKVGHFLGDGGLINLPIGFIPDYFRMADIDSTTTNAAVVLHEWFKAMETHEAAQSREGWALGFATLGYVTLHADDAGITAYNVGSQIPTIQSWTKARGDAATARSVTAPGVYIKPTRGGGDTGSIFECIVDGPSAATEPTWPVVDGAIGGDGSTQWQKVNVSRQRGGYQGVIIEDDIQTNTHEYYYLAILADQSVDHGDVDGWGSGIDPNA